MTDFGDPSGASLRLSNDERERAVAALQAHAGQGRLNDAELQSRTAAAAGQASQPGSNPYGQTPYSTGPAPGDHGRPVNRWGLLIVSIMPFVAVILFFVSGMAWGYQYSWLWFLLIPLAGAIVYGVDGGDRRRR
ncbi:MAG: DUF1707 domain-containing protein [Actinobacteria bacterium]|nr:DUF1707 domain-containing protein [Actinomycetota bacterium]